jgi:hypothetical protein
MSFKMLTAVAGGLSIVAFMAFIPPALYSFPSGKHRIAMAGRSTMDHWFKSWNWPYPFHRYAIWRNWPIPYGRYAKAGYYFDLVAVPTPSFSEDPLANGQNMLDAIAGQTAADRYDAVFFKFCYIDFDARDMTADVREKKLRQMTGMVEKVHGLTQKRGQKLVLGTALPVQQSSVEATRLRKDFTDWVKAFGQRRADVAVVDLFTPLVDEHGRLRPEFARAPYDDHLNWNAFRQLDPLLFKNLEGLFGRM